MNMNWWNIVKSTPRSKREKKEEQQLPKEKRNEPKDIIDIELINVII